MNYLAAWRTGLPTSTGTALDTEGSPTLVKVTELVDRKQPKYYDEAAVLLKDLRDLAKHQERSLEFTIVRLTQSATA